MEEKGNVRRDGGREEERNSVCILSSAKAIHIMYLDFKNYI